MNRVGVAVLRSLTLGVAGILLILGAPTAVALPEPSDEISLDVQFGALAPGVPQTRSATFSVPSGARVVDISWVHRDGILEFADLVVELCDTAGRCTDRTPSTLSGTTLTAHVTATISAQDTQPGTTGYAIGRINLVGTDGTEPAGPSDAQPPGSAAPTAGPDLPRTGSDVLVPLLWVAALVCVGGALLAWSRRGGTTKGQS